MGARNHYKPLLFDMTASQSEIRKASPSTVSEVDGRLFALSKDALVEYNVRTLADYVPVRVPKGALVEEECYRGKVRKYLKEYCGRVSDDEMHEQSLKWKAAFNFTARSFVDNLSSTMTTKPSDWNEDDYYYVAKVVEDVSWTIYKMSIAPSPSQMKLAIVDFMKFRCDKPLVVTAMDFFCDLFGFAESFFDVVTGAIDPDELVRPLYEQGSSMHSQGFSNFGEILKTLRSLENNFESVLHSPIYLKLYEFVSYLFAMSVFDKVPGFDLPMFKAIKKQAIKSNKHMGLSFLHCMFDTLLFVAERGHQAVVLKSVEPLLHGGSTYEKWFEESLWLRQNHEFISCSTALGWSRHEYMGRLGTALDEGHSITKVLKLKKAPEAKFAEIIVGQLEVLRSKELSRSECMKSRRPPFATLVYGMSCIGKSIFMQTLHFAHCMAFNLPQEDEYKFVVAPNAKHWNNFQSSMHTVVLDDVAAFTEKAAGPEGDKTVTQILQLQNTIAHCPEQASLEDKGKTPLKVEFILGSTNTHHMNIRTYFKCPYAVARRFPVVIDLKVKPEFQSHYENLDPEKIGELAAGEYMNIWVITVQKVIPVKSNIADGREGMDFKYETLQVYTDIDEFFAWYLAFVHAYRENQLKAERAEKAMRAIPICKVDKSVNPPKLTACWRRQDVCICNIPKVNLVVVEPKFEACECCTSVFLCDCRKSACAVCCVCPKCFALDCDCDDDGYFESQGIKRDSSGATVYRNGSNTHDICPVCTYERAWCMCTFEEYFAGECPRCFQSIDVCVCNDAICHRCTRRAIACICLPCDQCDEQPVDCLCDLCPHCGGDCPDECLNACSICGGHVQFCGCGMQQEADATDGGSDDPVVDLEKVLDFNKMRADVRTISEQLAQPPTYWGRFTSWCSYRWKTFSLYCYVWRFCFYFSLAHFGFMSGFVSKLIYDPQVGMEFMPDFWKRIFIGSGLRIAVLLQQFKNLHKFVRITGTILSLAMFSYGTMIMVKKFVKPADPCMCCERDPCICASSECHSCEAARKEEEELELQKFEDSVSDSLVEQGNLTSSIADRKKGTDAINPYYQEDIKVTEHDYSKKSKSWAGLSLDEVKKKISYNCATLIIRLPNGKCKPIKAFCVGGQLWVTTNHSLSSGTISYEVFLTERRAGVTENTKVVMCEESIYRLVDRDLAFFVMRDVPCRPFMIELFSETLSSGVHDGIYLKREQLGHVTEKRVSSIKFFKNKINTDPATGNRSYADAWLGKVVEPTQIGDCGSVLVLLLKGAPVLAGVHYLGNDKDTVATTSIRPSDIHRANEMLGGLEAKPGKIRISSESAIRNLIPIEEKAEIRFVEQGSAVVLGGVDGVRPMSKSEVYKTPLFQPLRARGWEDEHGAPQLRGWKPARNMLLDIVEPQSQFDPAIMKYAAQAYFMDVRDGLLQEVENGKNPFEHLGWLSVRDAVNGVKGVKYLDGMKRSTSAGFPWQKSKKGMWVPAPTVDNPDDIEFSAEILNRTEKCLLAWSRGERYNPIFNANLKDEVRSKVKCESAQTRGFTGAPVEHVLAMRIMFLTLVKLAMDNQFLFECAAGIVATSKEWHKLRNYLTRFGRKKLFDGDYGKYDKKFSAPLMINIFLEVLIKVAELSGRYTEEQLVAMRTAAFDVAFPWVHFFRTLLMLYGTNPSGQTLTTLVNCIGNSIYMRCAFLELHPIFDRNCHSLCVMILKKFKEFVALITYGDDNAGGVSDEAPWFNHTAISKYLGDRGITYTVADKTSESVEYKDIDDITFLKRSFKMVPGIPFAMAQLEEKSIRKMLMYGLRSNEIGESQQAVEKLGSAMREYWFYGRKVYDSKMEMLSGVAREAGIDHLLPKRFYRSYDSLKEAFLDEDLNSFHNGFPEVEELDEVLIEQ